MLKSFLKLLLVLQQQLVLPTIHKITIKIIMNSINTKVQQLQQQKEELDAKIAKLEELEYNTAPVKNLLASLLADYATEASEELPIIWEEILAIGQQHGLSVQPLAVDELQQWEADRTENEKLKKDLKSWQEQHSDLETDLYWRDAKIDDLEKELAELRSQLAQTQPELWPKGEVVPELKNLYQQEALTENTEAESESIPALTLWQPWATLIQQEVKRIETRSWATNYRGPIAIHAAKKPVDISDYPHLFQLVSYGTEFPFGAVVAIVNLVDCVEMTPEFIAQQSEQELKCGDWQPGRFAWVLEIIRLVPPIPATGGQKLWNWSGTSIAAELEYLEKLKATPEYEADECNDTIESVLSSHGFFMPDVYLGDCYPPERKYEDYQDWAIYYDKHDRGVTGIGLYNEQFGFWDASTEMIGDDDPTFPQNFTDYDAIVAWTRQVIDEVVAATPVESSEYSGQIALEIPEPESETETILTGFEYHAAVEQELGCNWEDEDEAMSEKLTELQKLLAGNSNFTFEDLEVSVAVQSVFTEQQIEIDGSEDSEDEDDDDPATEEVEEALFICNAEGTTKEYYHDAKQLVRGSQRLTTIIKFNAEQYAKQFLRDFPNDAKIREKIAQWNADETLQSNQQSSQSVEPESAKSETDTEFEAMGFNVRVYPQYGESNLVGATFRFMSLEEKPKLVFATSLLATEIGDLSWKVVGEQLIMNYRDKEAARLEKLANPYAKEEDKFVEFVKISNCVGYLKQRENGEILTGYVAFSNKKTNGIKTEKQAKARAQKWADWLKGVYQLESDAPRIAKRMNSENSKQPFAYEVKIKGVSIGQLIKLAEEDFSLLPGEVEERQQNTELLRSEIKTPSMPLSDSSISPDLTESWTDWEKTNFLWLFEFDFCMHKGELKKIEKFLPGTKTIRLEGMQIGQDYLQMWEVEPPRFVDEMIETDNEFLTDNEVKIVELIRAALSKFNAEAVQEINLAKVPELVRNKVWESLSDEEQKAYELLLKLEFAQVPDFSLQTPEFITTVDGKQGKSVFLSLRAIDGETRKVWRYQGQTGDGGYPCKEAAAVAAWL